MSILRWIVPALVFASAVPVSAQVSLIFGASVMKGRLQTPYAGRECALDMKTGATGAMLHAGVGLRDFAITGGYITAHGSDRVCDPPDAPANGIHRERVYRATHTGIYGWAFAVRYTPSALPVMAYAGTGLRFGGGEFGHNQFVNLGAGLRTRGSLSLFAVAEVTQLRTHFIRYDHEYHSGSVISSTEIDRGRGWRSMEMLRFGVEYEWTFARPGS